MSIFILQGLLHSLNARSVYFATLTLSGNEGEGSRFFAEPALSEILHFVQNDKKRRAQNDMEVVLNGLRPTMLKRW
jgi:hypothetical protein